MGESMKKNFDIDNRELDIIDTKSKEYTWIINSTGSNTKGTTFSPDLKDYLLDMGFEKIYPGNPMYGTTVDYTEDEIKGICNTITNMRKDYGQKIDQIQCGYFRGSSITNLRFDLDNIDSIEDDIDSIEDDIDKK